MSSNTGYIMTLANSIIGVGILAMPFCFQKCGILLSILLLIGSNLVTRLACHYLIKTSIKARRRNLEFIASYVFGASGKLMAELCVIGYLMGTCITYFVVVGDLGPQIIAKLFNLNHSDSLRTFTMIVVTIFCIIPLCLLRNIESLSAICISSILFYFCLVLKIFFESDTKMLTTYWYENVYWWRPSGITQCLPIFSMALSCQMQVFEIYESLPTQTIERMNYIVKQSIHLCTMTYICVGFFGYVAFYDQGFSGNVLLSLKPSLASDIIQMGFVISVAVSFPLMVFPCRASLYSLLYHRSHSDTAHYIPEHRFKYITISMVLVALIIGILIPSIELIIGLVGSTIGVAICIMFPACCFIKTNKKNSTERLAAQFLVVFGFCVMILGTYANLGAIDEHQSGVNIPIDRLPDIHVTHANKDIHILPSKMEQSNHKEADIIPNKPVDTLQGGNSKVKIPKRKLIKTNKTKEQQQQPVQLETAREINLVDDRVEPEPQIQAKKLVNEKPDAQKNDSPLKSESNLSVKSSNKPKSIIASQDPAAPTKNLSDKKNPNDSLINKDAIQKEEREIEFNANQQRLNDVERTQEILNAVKNQLSKQNEANHKIVLQKINEISEKVNQIAQKDEQLAAPDTLKLDEANNLQANENDNEKVVAAPIKQTNDLNDNNRMKKPLPPVPIAKLIAERKMSSISDQVSEPKIEVKPTADIVVGDPKPVEDIVKEQKIADALKAPPPSPPERIEEGKNANVGRDLLSHQIAHVNAIETNEGGDKTEN